MHFDGEIDKLIRAGIPLVSHHQSFWAGQSKATEHVCHFGFSGWQRLTDFAT
jgi:hypothetical protein